MPSTASTRPELNSSVSCLAHYRMPRTGTDQPLVAMRDLYMKSGQGFILVFSITSSSSMSEVEMLREEITRIKDDEHVPIVIVGNKADLEESRAVPRQRAFSASRMWNAPYYETSARTRGASA